MKKENRYEEWLKQWILSRKGFIKESTYANYSTAIINQIIPALGNNLITDITEKKLQQTVMFWLNNGRKDGKGGLAEKTVKDLVTIVKLSLKAASKEKLIIPSTIEILYPKTEKEKKLKVFSKENQIILAQSIYLDLKPKSAGILFCLHTGVRIGEICAIQWKDIDLENKTVTINKTIQRIFIQQTDGKSYTKLIITTPKTKASNRIIPLSATIYPILRKMQTNDPNTYLLTNTEKYLEPRTYRGFYDRFIKRLEIEHINFHGLRHTFATRLIESGADYKTVSELLGHASVMMTLNLYVHPQMEQKRKAVELINDFL